MKKVIYILFISIALNCESQELKIVHFNELKFEVNKDTSLIIAKKGTELLNGNYKILGDSINMQYSISTFRDGKVSGIQKSYRDGILTQTREFKDGMKNGYEIAYDQSGELVQWKINFIKGKQHGLSWWVDQGNVYYINGKECTKAEFEVYERKNKRN